MRKTSHGASAQSKPNTTGAKLIQHHAKEPLYPAAFSAEIARLSALRRHSRTISSAAFHKTGRSAPTRALDAVLDFIKRYLFPIYWVLVGIGAFLLYAYARAIRATAKIVTVGRYRWPDFPEGSVLVVWHGSAPSLLVAFTARRPNVPVKLMVSSDSRGDCVALFCRWLGFEIVRGDFLHGGWKALIDIANDVRGGTAALISPDGGGPPLFARVGAVALASAAGVPLVPIGADCRPSLFERHKWDKARNPLPFGRIAISCGAPLAFPLFENAEELEDARRQLQDALDDADGEARAALGSRESPSDLHRLRRP